MGKHPYYPGKKSGLRMLAVAYDGDQLGRVMWHKLTAPGPFQMIKDSETGMWRAIRSDPADPTKVEKLDMDRKAEWRPAPPLLPARYIREIAWEDKKQGIPKYVRLINGTEIMFRVSGGQPIKGVDLDLAWFDEELDNIAWYSETMARLIDRSGILIWSATPQAGTQELLELHEKFLNGDDTVFAVHIHIEKNPYIPEEGKKQFLASLVSEDEISIRYHGAFAIAGRKVYPEFTILGHHGTDTQHPPNDWTRYLALDPGFDTACVVCCAVSPDQSEVIVHKAIYMKKHNAKQCAERIAKELKNEPMYSAFIIDQRMGRQTDIQSGNRYLHHFIDAFKDAGLVSRKTGNSFYYSCDVVETREGFLKRWMQQNKEGVAKMHLSRGALGIDRLCQDIKSSFYDKTRANKRTNRKLHGLDCLEYLAAFDPEHQVVGDDPNKPAGQDEIGKVVLELLKKKKKDAEKRGRMEKAMQRGGPALERAVARILTKLTTR
jgi:hypothetical protein